MSDVNKWVWVFDKTLMVCWNVENKVIVKMERAGDIYIGKLQDMPMELFEAIANLRHGDRIIKNIVRNAEDEFFRAYLRMGDPT